jgi:GntR family transcriptional regulator, transcriptional repressor for pyruvate dehydrogenase complex
MTNSIAAAVVDRESLEYQALSYLEASAAPNGSRSLCTELSRRGFRISEPTVGRLLYQLDSLGYTTRVGFRGRTLTEAGRERLRRIRLAREESETGAALLQSIRPSTLGELLELLVARRAIEREIARLAALNATEGDLAEIRGALDAQEVALARGDPAIPEDIRFHNAIASASANRVLRNALALMRRDESLAYLMVRLRRLRRSRIAAEHYPIVDAIAARDPEGAERAMLAHVDHLLDDLIHFIRTNPQGLGAEMSLDKIEQQLQGGVAT